MESDVSHRHCRGGGATVHTDYALTTIPVQPLFFSDRKRRICYTASDKKAVLSHRWPRDAPYIWVVHVSWQSRTRVKLNRV